MSTGNLTRYDEPDPRDDGEYRLRRTLQQQQDLDHLKQLAGLRYDRDRVPGTELWGGTLTGGSRG